MKKKQHKTKKLKIGKKSVDIDIELYPLVKMLNDYGIKTTNCCQDYEGRAFIQIKTKGVEVYLVPKLK